MRHSTVEGSTLAAAQATEDSASAMVFLDIIMLRLEAGASNTIQRITQLDLSNNSLNNSHELPCHGESLTLADVDEIF